MCVLLSLSGAVFASRSRVRARVPVLIGVNFYKAARLEPPPLFKLLGFRASEPPIFCHMHRPL